MAISEWGRTGEDAILKLARSFPSLANMEKWDVSALLRYMPTASHGERLAAQFVLGVWNWDADWWKVARSAGIKGSKSTFARFDLMEAMGVWDPEHIAAAMAWMRRPFWP